MNKRLWFVGNLALLTACGGQYADDTTGSEPAASFEPSARALAGFTVAPIFRSKMVVQRDATVPVFGTAAPGVTITVELQGQVVTATANTAGAWLASLAPMPASTSPSAMTVTSNGASITFTDVQVGEVWLCAGQSNMGKPLSYADGSAPYIADAANHNLRLFRMTNGTGPAAAAWQVSDATTAATFSAVCYFMGLDLSEDLNVPVGLIQASDDGSAIAEWEHSSGGTGVVYDTMVKPLEPYAIKGVLWYQGESNGGDVAYLGKLTSLIGEWRADWGVTSLPFGIVQLPATKWTASRLAQFQVSQTVPGTYLVVTSDLPGSSQLHPTAKYLVGIRSSIGARGAVYGEPIEFSGPVPASTSYVAGRVVVVNFSHTGSGLTTDTGAAPSTFEVAATSQYVSATAALTGTSVQAQANRVATPKHVRYGFGGPGNLRNLVSIPTEGGSKTVTSLPASLFQLDFP